MALRSVSGTLASADLLEKVSGQAGPIGAARALLSGARMSLGPAAGARHVFDVLLLPLLHDAGLQTTVLHDDRENASATFGVTGHGSGGIAVACGWGADLRRARER